MPSKFSFDVFVRAGVPAEKVVVVPEAVDTDYYDPDRVQPISASSSNTHGVGTSGCSCWTGCGCGRLHAPRCLVASNDACGSPRLPLCCRHHDVASAVQLRVGVQVGAPQRLGCARVCVLQGVSCGRQCACRCCVLSVGCATRASRGDALCLPSRVGAAVPLHAPVGRRRRLQLHSRRRVLCASHNAAPRGLPRAPDALSRAHHQPGAAGACACIALERLSAQGECAGPSRVHARACSDDWCACVAQRDMPSVYRSMDCFVLATRGEGWGRPIAEAMAMGLPAIATAWSGPTEFMNKSNSYPLDFTLRAGQREFARQCR